MIIAAVALAGILSVFNIRMEYFPDMEMPMEAVYIVYPGADADTVGRLATEPVEELGSALLETVILEPSPSSYLQPPIPTVITCQSLRFRPETEQEGIATEGH